MVKQTEPINAVSQRAAAYAELRRQIVEHAGKRGASKAEVDRYLRDGTRPHVWKDELPDDVLATVQQYYYALECLKESIEEALAISGAPDAEAWSEIIQVARGILEGGGLGR